MMRNPCRPALILIATAIPIGGAGRARIDVEVGVTTDVLPASAVPTIDVCLAPIEGFDDDASYVQSVAARAAELAMQAKETPDLPTRTDLLLAAANLILARELEPVCSGRLLGFTDSQLAVSREQVRGALERADAMLVDADTTLDEVRGQAEPPADWIDGAKRRLATLGVFAHALQAYLLPGEGPGALDAARRAASQLAVLLEDDRLQVAAAAGLWQAALRAREADPSRVMSVLGLALSRPRPGTLPFAFFARLLRCRILASGGGHVVGLALLTQLEDRSDVWLAKEQDRADALRAITFVETTVLRDWHLQLSNPDDSPQRQWCVDRMNALIEERFPENVRTLFRLGTAVPIVAAPEDAGKHELEPTEGQE